LLELLDLVELAELGTPVTPAADMERIGTHSCSFF